MTKNRIVYFVGAGLSKSLQQTREYPIPVMWDFVKIAARYAATDDVLLTTLTQLEEAGVFKESTSASIALAQAVAPPTTATAAQKKQLLDLMEARPGENIEDALVKATTLKTLKSDLLPLRFNFAISRLFQIVGWNVKSDVLREFMEQQRLGRNTATFVTFNYDLILERVLADMDLWNVADGYGVTFAEFVEIASTDRHMAHLRRGKGGAVAKVKSHLITTPMKPSTTKVLKPHGSLNWLCQFKGNYGFVGSPTHLALTADQKLGYLQTFNVELLERPNAMPWPQTGIFISAPTLKNPIPQLIRQEEDAIAEADDIFIIGWSVPQTDTYQLQHIASAISRRQEPFRRVVVIDTNQSCQHYDRIRKIFSPACSFEPWMRGFEAYVRRSAMRRFAIAIKRWSAYARCWYAKRRAASL